MKPCIIIVHHSEVRSTVKAIKYDCVAIKVTEWYGLFDPALTSETEYVRKIIVTSTRRSRRKKFAALHRLYRECQSSEYTIHLHNPTSSCALLQSQPVSRVLTSVIGDRIASPRRPQYHTLTPCTVSTSPSGSNMPQFSTLS